ncbi:MAG TPA: hypothetical protein VHX11_09815 [Acidobacteriaceae bacterium]|nr:hypothetical protein [Acidobacteriaceae bacterium]
MPEDYSLRQLFHRLVSQCYDSGMGWNDPEISSYVADLLTEFSRADNVYRVRDAQGQPVRELSAMLLAADPVLGTAASFGEERKVRKHIGDYTLFLTGMFPESMRLWRENSRDSFLEMVHAGKESYYIVSQFDLFEYAREAPFFGRLSASFEECVYGLSLVRGELDTLHVMAASQGDSPEESAKPPWLM